MKRVFLLAAFLAPVFLSACSLLAREQMPCHQMGDKWIGDCPEASESHSRGQHDSSQQGFGQFSAETQELPEVRSMQEITLSDGERFDLTAEIVRQEINGKMVKRLAYNGQIPGPLLKVQQGSKITVHFVNNTDVDTTIHPHGLRLDNKNDGIPGVTQELVQPGESYDYQFSFPDVGIYWYHPHVREDYGQELGLAGAFLVEPNDTNYWGESSAQEEVLVLDDLLVNGDGIAPFAKDYTDFALMGRFGNMLLINNQQQYSLHALGDKPLRLYLLNAANTRVFQFQIPGAQLRLIGGDNGRVEHEEFVPAVILGPSERAVVEVSFPKKGIYSFEHSSPERTVELGTLDVSAPTDASISTRPLRDNSADFALLRNQMQTFLQQLPQKSIRLTVDMMGMGGGMGGMMDNGMMGHGGMMMNHSNNADGIEWEDNMAMMNTMSTSENTTWKIVDEETGKANMDIDDWVFKKGDLVKIRIFNDPDSMHPMQHPIHFHGNRFLILARDGKVNENFVWKDTALVRSGETMDILVEFDNVGTWMAHCHIAEHLHSGMGFLFKVTE